jgi:hypothetical protein
MYPNGHCEIVALFRHETCRMQPVEMLQNPNNQTKHQEEENTARFI